MHDRSSQSIGPSPTSLSSSPSPPTLLSRPGLIDVRISQSVRMPHLLSRLFPRHRMQLQPPPQAKLGLFRHFHPLARLPPKNKKASKKQSHKDLHPHLFASHPLPHSSRSASSAQDKRMLRWYKAAGTVFALTHVVNVVAFVSPQVFLFACTLRTRTPFV